MSVLHQVLLAAPALGEDGSVAPLLANDPLWLKFIKALIIFVLLLLLTLFAIWFERKVVGRMQHRPGPNWNGPFGLLQSLADALKLIFKEGIMPTRVDKFVYIAAPVMVATPAFLTFSVIPLGGPVTMFGQETALQVTELSVSALAVLAFASLGVYGIALGGWSSGSTYPLLGGLRSAAQLISYEIAMGLSFVAVFIYSGTVSMSGIVQQQETGWYVWLLPVSFIVYSISMVGETNRAPFDMAEAEGELVAGFNTEYTSMRFGLFFLGEYINMINVSAISTTLFLGGWRAPWPLSLWEGANSGYWTLIWFFAKVLLVMFAFVWLRGTLPRVRYDQFMTVGWKVLIPVSLVWIVLVGTARVLNASTELTTREVLLWMGIPIVVLLIGMFFWPEKRVLEDEDEDWDPDVLEAELGIPSSVVRPSTPGYPIPPLNLKVPVPPIRTKQAAIKEALTKTGDPVEVGSTASGPRGKSSARATEIKKTED